MNSTPSACIPARAASTSATSKPMTGRASRLRLGARRRPEELDRLTRSAAAGPRRRRRAARARGRGARRAGQRGLHVARRDRRRGQAARVRHAPLHTPRAGILSVHGHLVYSAIASLDGYIADEHGKLGLVGPVDPEVHAFVNDLERPVGTHLYGRRMYEVLVAWETMDDPDPQMRDYAQIWRAAEKIVYSTHARGGLQRPHPDRAHASTPRPCARSSAPPRRLAIGGAALGGEALRRRPRRRGAAARSRP